MNTEKEQIGRYDTSIDRQQYC